MKTPRQLMISLTAFLFVSLFSINCFATDIPITNPVTSPKTGQSRAPFYIPLTAGIDALQLNLNFFTSVGIATITVYDEFGVVYYQITTDTSVHPDLTIPLDMWYSGNYSLDISYGSIKLIGSFRLN